MGRLFCSGVGRVGVGELLAHASELCAGHLVSKGQINDDALPCVLGSLQLLLPLPVRLLSGLCIKIEDLSH